MTRRITSLSLTVACGALALLLGNAPPAEAQQLGYRSFGIRGGLSVDPDQLVVGVHLDVGTLAKQVRLQPSFDIGFGDGTTVGTINVDAHYLFRTSGSAKPYAGGGLTIAIFDSGSFDQGFGETELEAGLSLVGGIQFGRLKSGSRSEGRYLVEGRLGVGNIPSFKLLLGINF